MQIYFEQLSVPDHYISLDSGSAVPVGFRGLTASPFALCDSSALVNGYL